MLVKFKMPLKESPLKYCQSEQN